ncbi:MAG: hypothetical protein KJ558_08055 [Gammaproteobacteria bacterium]|nr:hypothetical protein [Gammaproteobacteria bacterium]MBU1654766.1 hypothetical protein [Gammaproteobacteria bacterium]MBU1962078.1 hypothetical protein [Gammaproteobacteria bacterium]
MSDLKTTLRQYLSAAGLEPEEQRGSTKRRTLWNLTLRQKKRVMAAELVLDADKGLLVWRAALLKHPKQRRRFLALIQGDGDLFLAVQEIARQLAFARLLLSREDGPWLEVALPLSEALPKALFHRLLWEMLQAFDLRRLFLRALDGEELKWTPAPCFLSPPELIPLAQPFPKAPVPQKAQPLPDARVAEITRAIKAGEIEQARRLASGADLDIPATI